ncbi:IS66-like element accessory protein TnpA [Defluviimonas sp. SAOS-178_SWC]|uniref:IS66-like element accessory protein TnpA n=1 Tax=Defluviimonas sp. SAOS-178_SWC TaxID=3121287 RepID=UPI003221C98A
MEESFPGHRQVTATARRHGVSRSLLTIWRGQYRNGELGDETLPAFIPMTLSPDGPVVEPAPASVARCDPPAVQLEVVLRDGRRLIFSSSADPEMLARLLPVLEAR